MLKKIIFQPYKHIKIILKLILNYLSFIKINLKISKNKKNV